MNDGRPRTIRLTGDMNGQALRRDETDGNASAGDPHEVWYYFNGRQMAFTGNNGSLRTDYASSIDDRVRTRAPGTGAFRFGSSEPDAAADPMMSLDPITSYDQGSMFGSYTVQGGDTLPGIAAALWGDASLWYKLAEANGLTGASFLSSGQRLTVPAGVMRSTHNAATFRPYDPAETLGDTGPTNPKLPKKQNGCGIVGAILLTVVAVAVAVATAGAAVAALSPSIGTLGAGIGALAAGTTGLGAGTLIGIGAASGALGSIASQGFGMATGLQDGFSWTGVALAGISGAVGAGLGTAFPGGKILGAVARGAAGSALTQGISVAAGLQRKFDWAGVAAAGVIGGVGHALGNKLPTLAANNSLANHLSHTGVSAASAIAGAAARSLATGTSFGDNILAVLPDVIGSTLGNMIANGVSRGSSTSGENWINEAALQRTVGRAFALPGLDGTLSSTALAAPGLGNGAANDPRSGLAASSRISSGLFDGVISIEEARTHNAAAEARAAGLPAASGYYNADTSRYALTHSELERWRGMYGAALQANGVRFANSDAIEAGFVYNSKILIKADLDLAQQLSDFGKLYVDIGGMVNPALALAGTARDAYNGSITPAEVAMSLLPGARLGKLKAAERGADVAYDARAVGNALEARYPGQVTSRTLPSMADKNVGLAGTRHPVSGVVFDSRGFPIFDDIAAFDTRIVGKYSSVPNSAGHMRAATRDLREAIARGEVGAANFNAQQLRAIQAGKANIPGLTWHHHQDVGRMQLIPTRIHQQTGHVGGYDMWYR